MIMRVYRCIVAAGKDAEFRELAFASGHAWLREQPGLLAFYAGKPLPDIDDGARCMVQLWQDVAALKAAFGEDWRKPRKLPEELSLIVTSATVEHYEIADEFRSEN